MKKLLFSLAALAITSFAIAQDNKDVKHDFGKIKQGVPVNFDFAFQNISDKPVTIENAWASCGCTTPTKPDQPTGKGRMNSIKAGFNAQNPGPFDKTVYVKVQGIDLPLELKITGEVLTADAYAKYEAENKGKKSGTK